MRIKLYNNMKKIRAINITNSKRKENEEILTGNQDNGYC